MHARNASSITKMTLSDCSKSTLENKKTHRDDEINNTHSDDNIKNLKC